MEPMGMKVFLLTLLAGVAAFADVNFDREVRPILSDNCFSCHGPDARNRMANLRLDVPDGGMDPAKVLARVTNPDVAKRMPPTYSGHTLSPQQIDVVRQWIEQGAKWQPHWAFVAPKRPDAPVVKDSAWVRNPIDNFILARLEKEGLKPSPAADKATLLRRVSYDLTGLPPSLAELNSFLADKSPNAYEKRVDALLKSPRYGERMAMQWLDLARYADTHGYHIDSSREMWHWRDWVIDAYNRNMPYDEFTIAQLAGDLIPNATTEQKIASGFNRNHMIDFEGGAIPEEYQVEYVVDRLEATSVTWMGLTMGCARCHDHKYDPIAQRDFYRFFAFFNNVSEKGLDGRTGNAEPYLPLPSPEQKARQEKLNLDIRAHEVALPEDAVSKAQADWEKAEIARVGPAVRDGLVAHYEFDGNLTDSSGHYQYGRVVHGDLTYSNAAVDKGADFDGETHVVFGHVAAFDDNAPFSIALWLKVNNKLRETVLQQGGLEIALDDFELAGIQQRVPRLYVTMPSGLAVRTVNLLPWPENMNHLVVDYDGSAVHVFVNGSPAPVETLHAAGGVAQNDGSMEIVSFKGKLDDLRIYGRELKTNEITFLQSQESLRAVLSILPDKRSKEQKAWIRDYYLTQAAPDADRKAWSELKSLRQAEKKLTAEIPTTMVMSEIVASEKEKPRETFILARGDYRNQTDKVTPGIPAILPPFPKDAPANRLTLAKWLVDGSNPLTARVAVNRYWQMYFGTGIVKTAENFGSQGDPPSNPELLDWLATEFVRTGWDVKAMQRLIVTSAAYRQSSRVTPELLEKDPENRLIARGPRFRLPAEMIRDGELYESGLLKEKVGGPGVDPYQPKGVWEAIAFGDGFTSQSYTQGHGDDLYRRSMYTFWKRTAPPPEMITFDAPDREKCAARRTITNTPLQALVLLNDVTYVEAARALAQRMLLEGGKTADKRLEYGFHVATAREPAARELAVLRDTLNAELTNYSRHEDQASALVSNGESPIKPGIDKSELAAWTTVASMILNLDETVSKQ
jgi:Protein of unknown function (DUF1553)/Protein of unknown function (DUF1549)/Concanavalin A-like lectin/glucanases superfamily/Planctomycete cytochrome C